MLLLNPEIKSRWYNKNKDGVKRPTIESNAAGLAVYTTTPFESPVLAKRRLSIRARIQAKQARLADED